MTMLSFFFLDLPIVGHKRVNNYADNKQKRWLEENMLHQLIRLKVLGGKHATLKPYRNKSMYSLSGDYSRIRSYQMIIC